MFSARDLRIIIPARLVFISYLLSAAYRPLTRHPYGVPLLDNISSQAQAQTEAVELCILASIGTSNQERIEFEFSRKPDPAQDTGEKRKEGKTLVSCFVRYNTYTEGVGAD